jgi:catalase
VSGYELIKATPSPGEKVSTSRAFGTLKPEFVMPNPSFTLAEGTIFQFSTACPPANILQGQPVANPSVSTTLPTLGSGGITTLGDTLLIETLSHFNRERIPERSAVILPAL